MRRILSFLAVLLMAITFRAEANNALGASSTITIAKPTGTANGDMLRCYIAAQGGAGTPGITPPPGWNAVGTVTPSPSAGVYLFTFGRQGKAADPADWTFLLDSARNVVGCIIAYRDSTASSFTRVCANAIAQQASDTSYPSPQVESNVANQMVIAVYAAATQDTWTQDASATERFDGTTTSGSSDVALSIAELALSGTGTTPVLTATLDTAAAEGVVLVELLTVMGMAQGAGTPAGITVHDNAKMADATKFNLAELQMSYPADFRIVGAVGPRKIYELVRVSGGGTVTMGQTSSPQATKWLEVGVGLNTNNRSLITNANNLSSWTIDWEDVFITHDGAAVTFYRGNLRLVDCRIDSSAAVTVANGAASLTGEVRRCLFTHPSGIVGALTFGSSTFPLETLEDITVNYSVGAGNDICAGIFATVARRFRFIGGEFRAFLSANAASAFDIEEVVFEGTPTGAFVRWGGSSANGWKLRGVTWVEGQPKFQVATSNSPSLANATLEGQKFRFQYVDAAGAPLPGKRLKITDELLNLVVDEVSDADGWITFGSGKDEQNIWLMDWYAVGTTPTGRDRYHLKIEMNPVGDPSYDASLESITHEGWEWPTTAPITNTTGSFLPVTWVQPLGAPVILASPEPLTFEDLPIPAEGVERIVFDLQGGM